ncbi:flavin reductase family protein [Mycobacterium sp. 21AC1]|uniref:flavin reductase family protein n=1 Tax=[Mycobacterium] appelbergii TaxID=2939269 RepID=UPI002938E169|nr:flavin reductase family protein [Mycobacterium sp. 21AC1]MDV3125920.1 flavin reductase family protein [Mycobacterium sp. 21AC1]
MTSFDPVKSGDSERDTLKLRRLYGRYPTGVAAVCALRDERPVGIVATSFTPVSMNPALVSLCVQHTSTTWPTLSEGGRLGVSVLASNHEATSRQIAAKNVDRFAGIPWFARESSAVFLAGAVAWLDCRISTSIPAGDHDVVLLEVDDAAVDEAVSPLVFHDSQFRTLSDR